MLDSTERKKKRVFHLSLLVNLRKFAWIPSFVRSYSFCTFHVSSRRYRSLIWLKRLMRLWIHITCVVFLCKRRRHRFCLLKLSFVVSVIAYHYWIYIKVVVFKLFSSWFQVAPQTPADSSASPKEFPFRHLHHTRLSFKERKTRVKTRLWYKILIQDWRDKHCIWSTSVELLFKRSPETQE